MIGEGPRFKKSLKLMFSGLTEKKLVHPRLTCGIEADSYRILDLQSAEDDLFGQFHPESLTDPADFHGRNSV